MIRSCSRCGKPLEFKGGNHKYCNSCRVIVRNMSVKKAKQKYNNKKKLQSLIAKGITNIKSCERCEEPFEVKGGKDKYCPICSEVIRREQSLKRINVFRERWKGRGDVFRRSFGTGSLSKNPRSDFEAEHQVIRRELNRLGISHR